MLFHNICVNPEIIIKANMLFQPIAASQKLLCSPHQKKKKILKVFLFLGPGVLNQRVDMYDLLKIN